MATSLSYNETECRFKNISSKHFLHRLPTSIVYALNPNDLDHIGFIASNFINEKMSEYDRAYDKIRLDTAQNKANIELLHGIKTLSSEPSLVEIIQFLHGIKEDVQVLKNILEDLQLGNEMPAIKKNDASKMSQSVSFLTGRTMSGLSNSTDKTSLKFDLHHSYITNNRFLRRNALSEFEILQDYYVRLREGDPDPEFRTMKDDYHQIGSCSLISSLTERWFDGWHVLNYPLKVQCLLVHPDQGGVRCKDGSYPQQMGKMKTDMICFKWKTGCLWEKHEGVFAYPVVESKAVIHYTVLVTVGPSREMLVDWNIGQFDHESITNALLFCP